MFNILEMFLHEASNIRLMLMLNALFLTEFVPTNPKQPMWCGLIAQNSLVGMEFKIFIYSICYFKTKYSYLFFKKKDWSKWICFSNQWSCGFSRGRRQRRRIDWHRCRRRFYCRNQCICQQRSSFEHWRAGTWKIARLV